MTPAMLRAMRGAVDWSMRDLAEAGKLQGAVSTESAEEVDKFNKQLALLRANAEDASRSLTITLISSINTLTAATRP